MLILDFERKIQQVEWYPWRDSMGNYYHLPMKELGPIIKNDELKVDRSNKIKKLNEKIKINNRRIT